MNKSAFDFKEKAGAGLALLDAGEVEKGVAALMAVVDAYLRADRKVSKAALPHVAQAYFRLGLSAREACRFAKAAWRLENAYRLGIASAECRLALAESLIPAGEAKRAEKLCREVLKENPENAAALGVKAQSQLWQRKFPEAEKTLVRAIELGKKNTRLWTELGMVFEAQGKYAEAMTVFGQVAGAEPQLYEEFLAEAATAEADQKDAYARTRLMRAEKIAPRDAAIFFNIGLQYQKLGFRDDAQRAYLSSISLAPGPAAFTKLAKVYERSNDIKHARTMAQAALRYGKENTRLALTMAHCDVREGETARALSRLERAEETVPPGVLKADILNLMGKVYDEEGNVGKAYQAFQASKDSLKVTDDYHRADPGFPLRTLEAMEKLDLSKLPRFTFRKDKCEPKAHAFFAGFPRSGTTLLEKVLDAHPGIVSIEEKTTLSQPLRILRGFSDPYPGSLLNLTRSRVEELRRLYFLEAGCHAEWSGGKMLVDKLPLNLMHLPVIFTLFPEAKIIVGLRHPFACTLSCLMQHFRLNNSMANMMSLDEITRFYAAVMGLWLKIVRECQGPAIHVVRYEDVVADLEKEARRITVFLGIPWSDQMLNYAEHAKAKGIINTPSYHQVVKPVYKDSLERWRRYEKYFEPYKERLAPFCEAFGYSF